MHGDPTPIEVNMSPKTKKQKLSLRFVVDLKKKKKQNKIHSQLCTWSHRSTEILLPNNPIFRERQACEGINFASDRICLFLQRKNRCGSEKKRRVTRYREKLFQPSPWYEISDAFPAYGIYFIRELGWKSPGFSRKIFFVKNLRRGWGAVLDFARLFVEKRCGSLTGAFDIEKFYNLVCFQFHSFLRNCFWESKVDFCEFKKFQEFQIICACKMSTLRVWSNSANLKCKKKKNCVNFQ